MKVEVSNADTPEEIVEQGVGLIARGLFRMSEQQGPAAAAREASTILDHVRGHWMDLMRQASTKERGRLAEWAGKLEDERSSVYK